MSEPTITPKSEAYPLAAKAWVAQQINAINQQNACGQFNVDIYVQGGEPVDALITAIGKERKVIDNRNAAPGVHGQGHIRITLEK